MLTLDLRCWYFQKEVLIVSDRLIQIFSEETNVKMEDNSFINFIIHLFAPFLSAESLNSLGAMPYFLWNRRKKVARLLNSDF